MPPSPATTSLNAHANKPLITIHMHHNFWKMVGNIQGGLKTNNVNSTTAGRGGCQTRDGDQMAPQIGKRGGDIVDHVGDSAKLNHIRLVVEAPKVCHVTANRDQEELKKKPTDCTGLSVFHQSCGFLKNTNFEGHEWGARILKKEPTYGPGLSNFPPKLAADSARNIKEEGHEWGARILIG